MTFVVPLICAIRNKATEIAAIVNKTRVHSHKAIKTGRYLENLIKV